MNHKRILLSALFFFVLFTNVFAEEIPIDRDSVIMKYTANEVVIESFKQNNNLYIQPIAATLLTQKDIEQHNIINIKEFSGLVPNLYMPDYGSKMTSPVFIRGIGAAKNAPSVGLYVDGVPYFDRSSFDINLRDIERIEVLRGPQGTIYGRNTMGGIINVFTKSPLKTNETNLNLSAGNKNYYQTGISHYGNVDNKIGYSVSGNYLHQGGYFRNVTTDKKADPIDAISTRARLSWRIQPRLTAHLILAYEYSDQDGYPYRVYDLSTNTMHDINYNATSFYRRNMSTNGLNIEYVTDNFKLGSQSSFQFFDGKQGLDQDFTPNDLYYVDFYQRQQMYSQEFNIKSIKEDSKYIWQFGLFGFHQNYFQTNDVDYRTGDKRHAIQRVHNPTEGLAIYHQSTLNNLLVDNLSFIFGLRYDWEKTKNTLVRTTKRPDTAPDVDPAIKDKTSFSQLTPKASVEYKFDNTGLVYFSATKGYKTGGFNTTADDDKDRTFDPEHSWCYELGSKSGLLNNLLFLDFTLFYIHWNDQQISQTKPSGQGFLLKNAGKSVSKGVEFAAQINPLDDLNIQLSYGYTNAKYKDHRDYNEKTGVTTIYDNNYLPMVPQNTFAISANYGIYTNKNCLYKIIWNVNYTGIGKIYWNDINDFEQPYYGTINGKVSFMFRDFSVDLWAKNIAGKEYISYYFSTSGQHYVQKGRPFTCGVNMNLKF